MRAAARGTAMGLSSFASKPMEEVTAVNDKIFFQIYWLGSRDDILARMERARAAGAVGLILTTDWSFSHGRDWGSPPKIPPERMDLKTILKMSPEVITKPRWFFSFAKTLRPPRTCGTQPGQARRARSHVLRGVWAVDGHPPPPTWEDVAWLREQWGGPFLLKGMVRVDDAKRAVDAGVSALTVSNHGGNNLDGTRRRSGACRPSPMQWATRSRFFAGRRHPPRQRRRQGCRARRQAVMIGRAYLWGGLAANGQAGVENVLDILRGGGIDSALLGLGKSSIHELTREDILVPRRFHPHTRRLSAFGAGRIGDQEPGTGVAQGGAGVNPGSAADHTDLKSITTHAPTFGAYQVNSAYHRRVAIPPSELGDSTSRQLQNMSPALVVPVGSTEQHGPPHLPLDTDTRIATAVADVLAARLRADSESDWLVAPPAIGYGASGEHEGFAGTVSIGTSVLAELLVEFARSACQWASRLVFFVNGHGGNVAALRRAVTLLRYEGRDAAWCSCNASNADAHAGHAETSVLLHISPGVVRQDQRTPGNRAPLSELMPEMLRGGGVAAVSSLGVLGDPTTATAEEGEENLCEMVDACQGGSSGGHPITRGMLR